MKTDKTMPFGKYKGEPISALAKSERKYLIWVRDNVKLNPELKRIINLHLQ